jgi:glycosyltransferase involved in cell wall biosynthesis
LAPPGDTAAFGSAIHRLLEEPAQRRSAMGAAGRRRVEESLAWDRQSEAYLGIWQELLAQPLHPAVTAGGVA